MHYDFCTLFDRNYLFRGLALHESLLLHVDDFTLWVLCMDDVAYGVLERMRLPRVELISLAQFENEGLLHAKETRTAVEYCWTCTPSLPLYLLDHVPDIEIITYLDADLFFFSDPAAAYAEMDGQSIGIHEHRFSPEDAYQAENAGIYNVAFMVFRNDERARACLEWWRDRCNEWCYFRFEDGKMGDQKYLDDWPQRFDGVVVLQHPGIGLAPWNLRSHRIARRGDRLRVGGQPVMFYHFHSLSILGDGDQFILAHPLFWLGMRNTRLLYQPYVASLLRAMAAVRRIAPGYAHGISSERLEPWAKRVLQRAGIRTKHFVRTTTPWKAARSTGRRILRRGPPG